MCMCVFALRSSMASGQHAKATCLVGHTQQPNQLFKMHHLISQRDGCFNTQWNEVKSESKSLSNFTLANFLFVKPIATWILIHEWNSAQFRYLWKATSILTSMSVCVRLWAESRARFVGASINTSHYYRQSHSVMSPRPLVGFTRPERWQVGFPYRDETDE